MRRRFHILGFLGIALSVVAVAQSGPTLVGTGYTFPGRIIAPGQIVRLQITGLNTVLASPFTPYSQKATSVPLPTTMAGISVQVTQYVTANLGIPSTAVGPFALPILALSQESFCLLGSSSPACLITVVTVQIPTLLRPSGTDIGPTLLVISENNIDSATVYMSVRSDQIHVITGADNGSRFGSIVTHLDGSMVSMQSPAKPGEVVVIYAWGLGTTLPSVNIGELTPAPAPVALVEGFPGVFVQFDFSPNAPPKNVFEYPPPQSVGPAVVVQAYLTPGQVGLFQINVEVPTRFPTVPACDGLYVRSNLTISLSATSSTDGAAICVQPPQPVQE
jgi:uncharacterized protein (TIGR03437 family)